MPHVRHRGLQERGLSLSQLDDDDDDDTRAFTRVLQRDAIPTTDKQCLTVPISRKLNKNVPSFATSYHLGFTTTVRHSYARRSISSSNELPSGV